MMDGGIGEMGGGTWTDGKITDNEAGERPS